jgi:putative oxidoreductase
MKVLDLLFGPFLDRRPAVGLLVFRLVTGGALMLHGLPKIMAPFTWMHGAPVPAIFQCLAAIAEFGGGLALILGLLTPIACLGIICNMLVAIFMVHVPHGDVWVGQGHSFEPALGYLAAAVMLLLAGPGVISLDAKLFSRRLGSAGTISSERKETVAGWR